MPRFGHVQSFWITVAASLLVLLPACGGKKPAATSPFPARITLNPAVSLSLQMGSTISFSASAVNGLNGTISPTFTFASSNPGILDVSPSGFACAGTWNAPYYNVCSAAAAGTADVTASALGSTSSPTTVFVHPPIDSVQISELYPVNSPPPACPTQVALPAACSVPFNTGNCTTKINSQGLPYFSCSCLSQNQQQTLQATAFSHGVDITASVGPFTWSQVNTGVVTVTPIVSSSTNLATNQATVVSNNPGETQIVASASGVNSEPYITETCPVQCITMEIGQNIGQTSFITNKSTSETISATAVDVQGCIVPKPPLTWTSSSPAAIAAGSATTGCTGASCAVTTTQAGGAAITASCTPPTCNVGFPLLMGPAPLYTPKPVYPVNAISGLATGASTTTNVLATSQDCYSNSLCTVALYNISTSTNQASSPSSMPTPPNSLMFDPAGDKAYSGSQYGSLLISVANLGSSTNAFTSLPAASTTLGVVTGRVIGVSPSGNLAIFSDTVSSPNQVYVVNTGSSSATTTALNINGAITATFSPDNSRAYILGDGGNTLYVYSTLQALQTYALAAPAKAVAFSSSGAFAFVSGGDPSSNITIRNTCDNSPVTLPITGLPSAPTFLKMVPPGNAPLANIIPGFQPTLLDNVDVFFGVDNAGIDIVATTATASFTPTSLCPIQSIALVTGTPANPNPKYINLQRGTFHPLSVFVSPDGTQVYVVTSDQGILIYSFSAQSVSAIQLSGGAAPVSADITADGKFLYVAGTDGILHQLDTTLGLDIMEIPFLQLPNSSNNFCYQSISCSLNVVAIKP